MCKKIFLANLIAKIFRLKLIGKLIVLGLIAVFSFFYFKYYQKESELEVYIIKVYDGDTVTAVSAKEQSLKIAKERIKVRLFGIDAPELKQEFGKEAKDFLTSLCLNEKAMLNIQDTDKYGRKVARLYCKGQEVNKVLVKNGYAWAYTDFTYNYKGDELEARATKKGLWINKNAIEPKIYRKNHKG